MSAMREKTLRRLTLISGLMCWVASIVLTMLVVDGPLTPGTHPGVTSIVVLIQSAAITLTVVWAQFRVRRIMIAVLKAGLAMDVLQKEDKTK